MQAYLSLLNQVQGVASTPYQAYGGQEVAPINQQQLTGVGNVNTAAGNITAAGAPLTANDVQKWMSPYTQDVVNATQNQFNENNARANSIVTGNAAAQGALGGDRVGVAQALTQGQLNQSEAPVIAGLYNTGYGQALNTAEQQQGFGLNAAQAQMGAAQSQIGAGTLEQQNQQQQDTQARADYYQQQGYPFQTAQWLAQMETGVGSQLGGTSTSTGTGTSVTQGPTPNTWAQLAGLGISAASLFLNRGGRVKRAAGGYSGPYAGVDSWVPAGGGLTNGPGAPRAQPMQMSTPKMSADQSGDNLVKQAMGFAQKWQNSPDDPTTMGSPGVSDALPVIGGAGDYAVPTFMAGGGGVARGGYGMASFPAYERRGFQGGGAPWNLDDRFDAAFPSMPPMSFVDRYPTDPMGPPLTQGFSPAGDAFIADAYKRGAVPGVVPDPGLQAVSPQSMQDWRDTPATPSPTAAKSDDDEGDDETTTTPAAAQPVQGVGVGQPFSRDDAQAGFGPQPEKNFLGFNKLTPDMRNALLTAGLSMMANRRGGPGSFLGAAGEAGIAGVGAYNAAQKAQADRDLQQQKLKMEQETHNAQMTNEPLIKDANGNTVINPEYLKLKQKEAEFAQKDNWKVIQGDGVTTPDRLYNSATGEFKDVPPGQGQAAAAAMPNGTFDYRTGAPSLQKGDTVPEPPAIVGHSPDLLKRDAEYYLATGVLPKGSTSPRNQAGIAQMNYVRAVQNYAVALAASKGFNMAQMADLQRFGTQAAKFPLSRQGDQTVALGTAIRHLDSLRQYAEAWNAAKGDINAPVLRQAAAMFAKAWGSEAPTNLEQAARISGPEIIKAIGVAGAGTGGERFAQEEGFQPGASTQQVLGAIKVAQEYLAGQLPAKEAQARNVGFPHERFIDMVGGHEYDYLTAVRGGKGGEGKTGGTFTPPAGAIARQYQGKTYYYDPATKQPYPGQ